MPATWNSPRFSIEPTPDGFAWRVLQRPPYKAHRIALDNASFGAALDYVQAHAEAGDVCEVRRPAGEPFNVTCS